MRMRIRSFVDPGRPDVAALVAAAFSLLAAARAVAEEQDPEKAPPQGTRGLFDRRVGPGRVVLRRPTAQGEIRQPRAAGRRAEDGDRRGPDRRGRVPAARSTGSATEIDEAIRAIDKAKLYVPGATVQNRAVTRSIPLGPDDLLLVDAENVEIRGGDGPEVKCVVKKTVLGEIDKEQDLVRPSSTASSWSCRKSSGPEMFGFYKAAADRPALRHRIRPVPLQAVPRSRVHRGLHQGPDPRRRQPADPGGDRRTQKGRGASAASGAGTPS